MDNKLPVPKPTRSKNATGEIVKVLILAAVSFVVGFALIFFFLRPSPPEVAPENLPSAAINGGAIQDDTPDTPDSSAPAAAIASPVAAVPPGEAPDGVVQIGEPQYLKCWDKSGVETDGVKCDRLLKLENRFTERLYVVSDCKNEESGENEKGTLTVASEVNFDTGTVSFWNGAASDIRNASDVGDCLRNRLASLPVESIEHAFSRYRVFFTVEFREPAAPSRPAVTSGDSGPTTPPEGAGRLVDVIKDRVRVRTLPVTGDPIGTISSGNQVRLLKQQDDWCNIVTPNSNEGWMICSALQL